MQDRLADMLMKSSQGNPGAMTALVEIYKDDPGLAAGIMSKMILTHSHGSLVWLIYKDECGQDLEKTKDMFERWLASKKGTDSLGQWIVAEGLRSGPEAQYYLDQGPAQ